MKKILALVATVVACSAASAANFMSAESLLRDLTSSNAVAKSVAFGYIVGIADSLEHAQKICIPVSAKQGDPVFAVLSLLQQAPSHLMQMKAASFVTVSLVNDWPCRK